ncbi:MAG: hypothetical protein Q9202_000562 [Teloschistes flavicans]
MGKVASSKPPPGVYRDDPDRDDAASTSSAVLMEDVEYPDSDLPAYQDVPPVAGTIQSQYHETQSYLIQPDLPKSHLSRDETTTTTHYPLYSQDAAFLGQMVHDQAKYPPTFTARMVGTHAETRRTKEKEEKVTVTDFDVRLDMTHLLVPSAMTPPNLLRNGYETPSPGVKAYRGYRTKTASATESAEDADSYMNSYISSPFPVRSFTLNRHIINHDSASLETLLTSLIGSTNYRGHLNVSFPITHNRVTVYSPCWQNDCRDKTWLRWFFYLTFLWIFSWPYLWFVTRRWEVMTAVFPYSSAPDGRGREFVVKSEHAFFQEWKTSIRRAVVGKRQGWIDEEYRIATEEAGSDALARQPSTGNATADGALGFLRQAVNVGRDVAMAGGWGADS